MSDGNVSTTKYYMEVGVLDDEQSIDNMERLAQAVINAQTEVTRGVGAFDQAFSG